MLDAVCDKCPADILCFSFLLKSNKLPDLTVNAIFNCNSPRGLSSIPDLFFKTYHLNVKN